MIFLFLPKLVIGQIGGKSSFEYLNFPTNALQGGIGGTSVSIWGDDPYMAVNNPSLLNKTMHGKVYLSHTPWFGINNSTAVGAYSLDTLTTISVLFSSNNYGTLYGYDPAGNFTNNFTGGDFTSSASVARKVGNFSLGGTLKLTRQQIEGYAATALLSDLGASFIHPNRQLRVGFAVRNLGFAFDRFSDQSPITNTPLNIQSGISYKLEHMPLRFSFTTSSLETWDIVYQNPNLNNSPDPRLRQGDPSIPFFETLIRRVVLGGEFIFSKNLHARIGYNHLFNREMRLESGGFPGISIGGMVRIKGIEVAYSHSFNHAIGNTGFFTLGIDLPKLGIIKKESQTPISN